METPKHVLSRRNKCHSLSNLAHPSFLFESTQCSQIFALSLSVETMITRSSSAAKKKGRNVSFTLPESRILGDVTAENVPSSNTAAEAVTSNTGVDQEEQAHLVRGSPSILVAIERHQEQPLGIYWESKEAKNLFRPIGSETVIQAIDNQIQLLVSAFHGNDNWKSITDPDADIHNEFYLVPGSVAELKEQAMALSIALDIAKRDKPTKTWAICCEEAVTLIFGQDGENNLLPSSTPPSSAKLQEWYREFREKRYFLSKKKRCDLRKEKRDETVRLKKELDAAKRENAVLLTKIEQGLSKVTNSKEAAELLAEIEQDMTKIKIED